MYSLVNECGETMCCVHARRPFRIVTPSVTLARRIQYTADFLHPNVRMSWTDDEKTAVRVVSADLGALYVAPRMCLRIDKRREDERGGSLRRALQEELMYRRQITTSTQDEVLLLPLLRDVGVVIPRRVDHENARTLFMSATALIPERQ